MVSVICPVLNEAVFIKAWAENVTKFSDDIHVFDCGSTDGTPDILRDYGINVYHNQERYAEAIWQPYLWDEGEIRNSLINKCRGDWIVNLDADELFGDDFLEQLPKLRATTQPFIRFLHYQFWYSVNTIRIRQWKKDWWFRFYPTFQIRMFKNDPRIRYASTGNHAPLRYRGGPCRFHWKTVRIPFFHYHHLFRKLNDNRADEINCSGIRLQTYFGPHPEETRFYDWFPSRKIEIPARTDERIRELVVGPYGDASLDETERRRLAAALAPYSGHSRAGMGRQEMDLAGRI